MSKTQSEAVFLEALRFGESESSIVTMRSPSLPRFDAVAVENDIAAHMQERSATSSLNNDLLDVLSHSPDVTASNFGCRFGGTMSKLSARTKWYAGNSDDVRYARDERRPTVTRADIPVLVAADWGSYYSEFRRMAGWVMRCEILG
jgi:hypothetical protein